MALRRRVSDNTPIDSFAKQTHVVRLVQSRCTDHWGATPFPGRRAVSRPAAPGATGWTSAARRGRWRSRSGTTCRTCWRACWRAAASRSRRSASSRPDRAHADAGSEHPCRHGRGGGADRRRGRCGGRRSLIFGDYDVDGATSAATLARFLRLAGMIRSSTSRIDCSRATARMSKRSARLRPAAQRSSSRSDCGTDQPRAARRSARLGMAR